jgi:hypothetical protein
MIVENLIAKKDAEYPEDPAHKVCNGTQDPVTMRARNSRCVRLKSRKVWRGTCARTRMENR